MNATIGKKLKMTQVFAENGNVVPCTVVDVSGNIFLGSKTKEKHGYEAAIIGVSKPMKSPSKAQTGIYKDLGYVPTQVTEIRDMAVVSEKGTALDLSWLTPGTVVQVKAQTKGKGFQGVIRGHGMKGGPKTHGQSNKHRSVGSIAHGQTFAHVFKGRRMPKRFGNENISILNLKVVKFDSDSNQLYLSGSLPGMSGSKIVVLKK